jgi:hypothetical protein
MRQRKAMLKGAKVVFQADILRGLLRIKNLDLEIKKAD